VVGIDGIDLFPSSVVAGDHRRFRLFSALPYPAGLS
jgi:hypothetical protein